MTEGTWPPDPKTLSLRWNKGWAGLELGLDGHIGFLDPPHMAYCLSGTLHVGWAAILLLRFCLFSFCLSSGVKSIIVCHLLREEHLLTHINNARLPCREYIAATMQRHWICITKKWQLWLWWLVVAGFIQNGITVLHTQAMSMSFSIFLFWWYRV